MTTSIINKLTAALSRKPSIESTTNHSDSRKSDCQDEYHTIFTKRLSSESNAGSMEITNCSKVDDAYYHADLECSLDDFIGGNVDDEHSFNLQSEQHGHNQYLDCNRSITATPADSTCGFHNTFSVLEKQLEKTKYLKLKPEQIEYLLIQNKDLTVHNDTYIDIPINDHRGLHAVNGSFNSSMNDTNGWNFNNEDSPSHLELELEAMNRLRSLWNEECLTNSKIENNERNVSPTPLDSSLVEEFYQQDNYSIGVQNYNEYIYHVAKSRDGQLYIRVRRNLRLDQGKCYMEP